MATFSRATGVRQQHQQRVKVGRSAGRFEVRPAQDAFQEAAEAAH